MAKRSCPAPSPSTAPVVAANGTPEWAMIVDAREASEPQVRIVDMREAPDTLRAVISAGATMMVYESVYEADVYDALVMDNSEDPEADWEAAFEFLSNEGTHIEKLETVPPRIAFMFKIIEA